MRTRQYLIITIGSLLTVLTSGAQENLQVGEAARMSTTRQIYNQAESDYDIGRIDQAISVLQANIDSFEGTLRQSAYRLLALCYLSQDKDDEARIYAERLVKLNNYYNATGDPARFQDIISQLKGGIITTITTASSQSETINEAPAPITIITAEMIEELGYNKNLNQILATYVPGMAEITSRNGGTNLSMHGVYSWKQELILIMENGHRLNTRFDNCGPTSYSISTEKIDHIEVLRGPASSLYGNVAVSAVVNIITKSGRTADGIKAKYGYASYNTHRADLMVGTQFMDADIFAWASIYSSDGQHRRFSDGKAYLEPLLPSNNPDGEYGSSIYYYPDRIYVDGYKGPPSYDVGLTFRLKGFELMFSRKNVQKVQESSIYYGGYDYDRYDPVFGVKPGYGTEETHMKLGYTRQLGNFHLDGSVYSDWYSISYYDVSHDSLVTTLPKMDYEKWDFAVDENGNIQYETIVERGYSDFDQNREHTMGGILKASTDYKIGKMNGNVMAGAQYEHFKLLSKITMWNKEFSDIDGGYLSISSITEDGKENSLSFFVQDKHYILPQLILNAGCRYDFKYRHNEDVVRTLSPRLALMYVPNERFSLKLSYAEAFADLSFFFRWASSSGDDKIKMDPQHLSAIQLTAMGILSSLHLNYEINLFYNKYSNLFCWEARDVDLINYNVKNDGRLTNIGIEGTASYAYKRLSASLSLYYCHDTSSEHYYYNTVEKMVNNVPHFTFNLHGAYKLLQGNNHQLKVYGNSSYTGRVLNFVTMKENEDFYVDAKMIFDLGIQYRYRQRLQFSLDCENIFNTDHYICGPNSQRVPHFQRGRSLMASLSYNF